MRHGDECPLQPDAPPIFGVRYECQCVGCHCDAPDPTGPLGACTHCHRPVIVDGRVWRPVRV